MKIITPLVVLAIIMVSHSFDKSYATYDAFLQKYVCDNGVAYSKLLKDPFVKDIEREFSSLTKADYSAFSEEEKIAYLINAYNFFTILLIKDNYPLKNGIRDITSPWKKKFVPLFGEVVSLDHIEHEVLRKEFDEPRIHAALVCASKGCPALLNRAFLGRTLNEQLNQTVKLFLSDPQKNVYKDGVLYLSKIFQWYGKDFNKKHGSHVAYIQKELAIKKKPKVSYLKYDWTLNEVDGCK